MGEKNCGTQLKLTAILSGALFVIIAYRFITITAEKISKTKIIVLLGDCSFGIYFSHLAVMFVLRHIPPYTDIAMYPLNAITTITISCLFVLTGKRVLGKYGKYLAL